MSQAFEAVKISDNVYWVGAVDWKIRDFHGYLTQRGSTYNAYLVMADKVTLIDTVKAPFKDELLSRITSVIPRDNIDYIVSNHSEMDHSGCLPQMIREVKPEKVFASCMGCKALSAHFHDIAEIEPMKDGDILSLGNMNLSFLETRMLHWPDSMISYLDADQLLFSQDAFGMHLASGERFADEIPVDILEYEGAKYYANIILLYSPVVLKLLKRVAELNLPLRTVAPDHGPIWRKDLGKVIASYEKWATQKPTDKAVVIYDTMWGSTEKMAKAVAEGLVAGGTHAKLLSLRESHRSDVVTEILDAGALLAGSPTINNGIFPTLADVLTYLKGLKPRNLIGAAFGSYGWSGESVALLEGMMSEMKIDLVQEGLKIQYVPNSESLLKARELGINISKKLKETASG